MNESRPRMPAHGLYAITPGDGRAEATLLVQVREVLAAGCALLQYRDKHANAARRERLAPALATLCAEFGVPLIVNDDADLARRAGAAGVHLGQGDAPPAQVRTEWPAGLIGVTCHASPALAREAVAAGADYVAFGRFFASTTKPGAPEAPPALLEQSGVGVPVVAIGGIDATNGAKLVDRGARLLAVCAGVFDAPDPGLAAASLAEIIAPSRSG